MRRRHWVGIAAITIFLIYSGMTFTNALNPYVTFGQAKGHNGTVQVRGILVDDKITALENGRKIMFRLRDEAGTEAAVIYKGIKPDGLEQATGIVAIGRMSNDQFLAEKLLVKCPSKYQGGAAAK